MEQLRKCKKIIIIGSISDHKKTLFKKQLFTAKCMRIKNCARIEIATAKVLNRTTYIDCTRYVAKIVHEEEKIQIEVDDFIDEGEFFKDRKRRNTLCDKITAVLTRREGRNILVHVKDIPFQCVECGGTFIRSHKCNLKKCAFIERKYGGTELNCVVSRMSRRENDRFKKADNIVLVSLDFETFGVGEIHPFMLVFSFFDVKADTRFRPQFNTEEENNAFASFFEEKRQMFIINRTNDANQEEDENDIVDIFIQMIVSMCERHVRLDKSNSLEMVLNAYNGSRFDYYIIAEKLFSADIFKDNVKTGFFKNAFMHSSVESEEGRVRISFRDMVNFFSTSLDKLTKDLGITSSFSKEVKGKIKISYDDMENYVQALMRGNRYRLQDMNFKWQKKYALHAQFDFYDYMTEYCVNDVHLVEKAFIWLLHSFKETICVMLPWMKLVCDIDYGFMSFRTIAQYAYDCFKVYMWYVARQPIWCPGSDSVTMFIRKTIYGARVAAGKVGQIVSERMKLLDVVSMYPETLTYLMPR